MKITRKVKLDVVIADNPFDFVFACMTIFWFSARMFGKQIPGILPYQISYFVLRG